MCSIVFGFFVWRLIYSCKACHFVYNINNYGCVHSTLQRLCGFFCIFCGVRSVRFHITQQIDGVVICRSFWHISSNKTLHRKNEKHCCRIYSQIHSMEFSSCCFVCCSQCLWSEQFDGSWNFLGIFCRNYHAFGI